MQDASKSLKPISLELRRKSSNIIFDNAKFENAITFCYLEFSLHKFNSEGRKQSGFGRELRIQALDMSWGPKVYGVI